MLDPFLSVSSAVGAPPDHIKLIFCLLASYPLSSLYVKLPTDATRHYYSISVAAFFLLGVLRLYWGTAQLVFSIVGTYLLVCFNRTERMPWLVFAFVMGHLTINHIYRTIYAIDLDVIEVTGSQMVLVMKLSQFAFNVADGRRDVNDLDPIQLSNRLTKVPGLHSFLGFCLFFPSILVGPSFEFSLYHSLVNGTLFLDPPSTPNQDAEKRERRESLKHEAELEREEKMGGVSGVGARVVRGTEKAVEKVGLPKGRKRVAYVHMAVGLSFLALYAVLGGKATYDGVLDDSWWDYGYGFRLLYVQACGVMARTKYYAVWELTEGAIILCGLGFNGYDSVTGRTRWNRCRNVDVLRIETAENYKVLFDNWNMRTSVWLRECVYKRVTPKGKKPGFRSSMITFLTSAFWHGTQPGYYIAFVHGGILTALAKQFRRNVRPLLLPSPPPSSSSSSATKPSHTHTQPASASAPPPTTTSSSSSFIPGSIQELLKRMYDLSGWLFVQLTLNYLASSFLLLDLSSCLKFFKRTMFYGDVLILAGFGFIKLQGPKRLGRALGVGWSSRREAKKRKMMMKEEEQLDWDPIAAEMETELEMEPSASSSGTSTPAADRSSHPSIVISPPPPPPLQATPKQPTTLLSTVVPGPTTIPTLSNIKTAAAAEVKVSSSPVGKGKESQSGGGSSTTSSAASNEEEWDMVARESRS